MSRTKKAENSLLDKEEIREETEITAPEPEMPKVIEGTDGKVTMRKDGVGRRFHVSRIKEMESLGWEMIG